MTQFEKFQIRPQLTCAPGCQLYRVCISSGLFQLACGSEYRSACARAGVRTSRSGVHVGIYVCEHVNTCSFSKGARYICIGCMRLSSRKHVFREPHSHIELCIEGCTKSVGCRFKYRKGYVKLWALFVFDEIFFIFYSLLYFMRNS